MTTNQLIQAMRRQLKAASEPDFRKGVSNFFKEPVEPYGVRTTRLKDIERFVYREIKIWPKAQREAFMEELWKSGKLEEGAMVCHLHRKFAKEFAEAEFALFDSWLDRYVNNWAYCDGVASWLLAGAIANRPALIRKLAAWTKSKNRWRRRAAAVSLLQEAKQGRYTESIFRICDLLRADQDDLVRKGVGWLLKETYPKRRREVLRFLEGWRATAPRLVLRIAAEKMTAKDKKWLLTT